MKIEEILREYNVLSAPEGHHHSTTDFIQCDCPWCSSNTRKWRMGLSKDGRAANCWVCGTHKIIPTLVEITGERYEVIRELVRGISSNRVDKKQKLYNKLDIPSGIGPLLKPHIDYLQFRGFNVEELQKLWKIQGIGLEARLAWRIFIPVEHKGNVVTWTTRSIVDNVDKRYINAKKTQEVISIKKVLYGSDYARHTIVIVEGPTDVWGVGPGAVCTFGLKYTKTQLAKIAKYPVRVVCFDSQPEAQNKAKGLCHELQAFAGKTINVTLDAKDPGSAPKKEIQLLRKEFLD